MTAQIGGTITGPNLTAERKTPLAVPFSRGGNQLLMVVVTPIGRGASATPKPNRLSWSISAELLRPASAVNPEVRTIAHEKKRRTPNLLIASPEGICARAYPHRKRLSRAPA